MGGPPPRGPPISAPPIIMWEGFLARRRAIVFTTSLFKIISLSEPIFQHIFWHTLFSKSCSAFGAHFPPLQMCPPGCELSAEIRKTIGIRAKALPQNKHSSEENMLGSSPGDDQGAPKGGLLPGL